MFECGKCETVFCRDCLDDKLGPEWTIAFLLDDESEAEAENAKVDELCPKCLYCNQNFVKKRMSRKVRQIIESKLTIKHSC